MSKYAKFDRDDVIEKATNLYWEKGFHGTSMRNLQDVVDMRPGSIYASFGCKENLFKEALQYYGAGSKSQLNQCLQQADSTLTALRQFIRSAVLENRCSAPSGMCMLVKSIAELTEEQNELLQEARKLLSAVEDEFVSAMQLAIDKGELKEEADPQLLARYFQVQLMGLGTYASASGNDEVVESMIDNLFTSGPLAEAMV